MDPAVRAVCERLAELVDEPPGVEVLAEVLDFDLSVLDLHCRLLALRVLERHSSWLAGCAQEALVAAAGVGSGGVSQSSRQEDFADLEVAAMLRLSPVTASRRVETARQLCGRLRATGDALGGGAITFWFALSLVDAVGHLDDDAAHRVEAVVLDGAAGVPVGRLRARLRRAVIAAGPATADERHQLSAEERRVVLRPEPDAMAWLSVFLTAPEAIAAYRTLDDAAHRMTDAPAGVPGRIDGLRADAFLTAVLGRRDSELRPGEPGEPGGAGGWLAGARVQLTMDLPTALRLAEHPAQLDGYGPIPPGLARRLAADGCWQRLLTDPAGGHLLDVGRASYRPPAALQRYLHARDVTCRFPGCARAAARCDLDHAQPWDGEGSTCTANMGALCRRHHNAKTHGGWQLNSEPDGAATFTSPSGHDYRRPAVDHHPEHTARRKTRQATRSGNRRARPAPPPAPHIRGRDPDPDPDPDAPHIRAPDEAEPDDPPPF